MNRIDELAGDQNIMWERYCKYCAKEFEPPCGMYNDETYPDTHWGWELQYCCADCIRLAAMEDELALAMLLGYQPQDPSLMI